MFITLFLTFLIIYLFLKFIVKKDKWAEYFEWDLLLGDFKASLIQISLFSFL